MNNYNQKEHLKRIHENGKAETAEQKRINFNSVSKEVDVSEATFYSNTFFRNRIEPLRNTSNTPENSGKKNVANFSASKDALIDSLKRKNMKLEIENGRLRNDLKMVYGQIYQKS